MPVRLLGVGLILTVVAGGLTAFALFKSFSLNDALILGVVLAPTDAGLGSAVVTDDRLPQVVRQSLNVESGLNDGICVPLLLILLATAAGAEAHPLTVVAEEIGYGVLCGAGAALLSAGIVVLAGSAKSHRQDLAADRSPGDDDCRLRGGQRARGVGVHRRLRGWCALWSAGSR